MANCKRHIRNGIMHFEGFVLLSPILSAGDTTANPCSARNEGDESEQHSHSIVVGIAIATIPNALTILEHFVCMSFHLLRGPPSQFKVIIIKGTLAQHCNNAKFTFETHGVIIWEIAK